MAVTGNGLPSGDQFTISAGEYRATVVELGGGLRTLERAGLPLLDGYAAHEACEGGRGQLLIPWPNRIDEGRYRFADVEQQLALTEPERSCAIHGLLRWSSWRAAEHGDAEVRMTTRLYPQPGWPHVLDVAAHYALDADDGLVVTLTATNAGPTAAPYGNGAHPYLTLGAASIDAYEVQLPAAVRIVADERGIPVGREAVDGTVYDFQRLRELAGVQLDDAFTALERDADERAWVRLVGPSGERLSLWTGPDYAYLQVFTGDSLDRPEKRRTGLAVEPMTCPPDAFRSGECLLVLDPEQSVSTAWGIVAA
jgi:aldose 1-epimerase